MSHLSILAILLTSLLLTSTAQAGNTAQDTERLKVEGPEIRRKLQANDWILVGQSFARRSIDQSHFVVESMSVFYGEENNPQFRESLRLPPGAEVYYDMAEYMTIQVDRFTVAENIVIPWHMSFGDGGKIYVNNRDKDFEFQYLLKFDPERPNVVGLHLLTITNKPGEAHIFGDLQFIDGQLRLVQNIGSQQIRWDFAKDQ